MAIAEPPSPPAGGGRRLRQRQRSYRARDTHRYEQRGGQLRSGRSTFGRGSQQNNPVRATIAGVEYARKRKALEAQQKQVADRRAQYEGRVARMQQADLTARDRAEIEQLNALEGASQRELTLVKQREIQGKLELDTILASQLTPRPALLRPSQFVSEGSKLVAQQGLILLRQQAMDQAAQEQQSVLNSLRASGEQARQAALQSKLLAQQDVVTSYVIVG